MATFTELFGDRFKDDPDPEALVDPSGEPFDLFPSNAGSLPRPTLNKEQFSQVMLAATQERFPRYFYTVQQLNVIVDVLCLNADGMVEEAKTMLLEHALPKPRDFTSIIKHFSVAFSADGTIIRTAMSPSGVSYDGKAVIPFEMYFGMARKFALAYTAHENNSGPPGIKKLQGIFDTSRFFLNKEALRMLVPVSVVSVDDDADELVTYSSTSLQPQHRRQIPSHPQGVSYATASIMLQDRNAQRAHEQAEGARGTMERILGQALQSITEQANQAQVTAQTAQVTAQTMAQAQAGTNAAHVRQLSQEFQVLVQNVGQKLDQHQQEIKSTHKKQMDETIVKTVERTVQKLQNGRKQAHYQDMSKANAKVLFGGEAATPAPAASAARGRAHPVGVRFTEQPQDPMENRSRAVADTPMHHLTGTSEYESPEELFTAFDDDTPFRTAAPAATTKTASSTVATAPAVAPTASSITTTVDMAPNPTEAVHDLAFTGTTEAPAAATPGRGGLRNAVGRLSSSLSFGFGRTSSGGGVSTTSLSGSIGRSSPSGSSPASSPSPRSRSSAGRRFRRRRIRASGSPESRSSPGSGSSGSTGSPASSSSRRGSGWNCLNGEAAVVEQQGHDTPHATTTAVEVHDTSSPTSRSSSGPTGPPLGSSAALSVPVNAGEVFDDRSKGSLMIGSYGDETKEEVKADEERELEQEVHQEVDAEQVVAAVDDEFFDVEEFGLEVDDDLGTQQVDSGTQQVDSVDGARLAADDSDDSSVSVYSVRSNDSRKVPAKATATQSSVSVPSARSNDSRKLAPTQVPQDDPKLKPPPPKSERATMSAPTSAPTSAPSAQNGERIVEEIMVVEIDNAASLNDDVKDNAIEDEDGTPAEVRGRPSIGDYVVARVRGIFGVGVGRPSTVVPSPEPGSAEANVNQGLINEHEKLGNEEHQQERTMVTETQSITENEGGAEAVDVGADEFVLLALEEKQQHGQEKRHAEEEKEEVKDRQEVEEAEKQKVEEFEVQEQDGTVPLQEDVAAQKEIAEERLALEDRDNRVSLQGDINEEVGVEHGDALTRAARAMKNGLKRLSKEGRRRLSNEGVEIKVVGDEDKMKFMTDGDPLGPGEIVLEIGGITFLVDAADGTPRIIGNTKGTKPKPCKNCRKRRTCPHQRTVAESRDGWIAQDPNFEHKLGLAVQGAVGAQGDADGQENGAGGGDADHDTVTDKRGRTFTKHDKVLAPKFGKTKLVKGFIIGIDGETLTVKEGDKSDNEPFFTGHCSRVVKLSKKKK